MLHYCSYFCKASLTFNILTVTFIQCLIVYIDEDPRRFQSDQEKTIQESLEKFLTLTV